MAWLGRGARVLLAILVCASSRAQSSAPEDGRLIVWIVSRAPAGRVMQAGRPGTALPPPEYKEQTAGSFGQTAGSVGQTAGSAGTTMGNFGQTAGSTGQTAGSAGQSPSTLPSNVTSQTAGSAGRTMGEFGVSTTDLPAAAAAANAISRPRNPVRDSAWDMFLVAGQSLRGMQVQFVQIFEDELEARLTATAGTDLAPDVLVGNPLPAAWSRPETGLVNRIGVYTLWGSKPPESANRAFSPQWGILRTSKHPRTARAFALWMAAGSGSDPDAPHPLNPKDPIAPVAIRALRSVLEGVSPAADADREMASFDAATVAGEALMAYGVDGVDGLDVQVEVTAQEVHGPLAMVSLQAVASGKDAFGFVRATEVLRRDDGGRWRVLQITPTASAALQLREADVFRHAALDVIPVSEVRTGPLGITQAAPIDGDVRSPQPELWWQNHGGATLQVVEWQVHVESGWAASQLVFVPDANARLRTEVTASFARLAGKYRWRVWSVGHDGALVLSDWRGLMIAR